VPLPLSSAPLHDFVGRTCRRLRVLPLDPVAHAFHLERGVGSDVQEDLWRAMRALRTVALRAPVEVRLQGFVDATVELTVLGYGRLYLTESRSTEVAAVGSMAVLYRAAAPGRDVEVRLPCCLPLARLPYCRKGDVPLVCGYASNLLVRAEAKVGVIVAEKPLTTSFVAEAPGGRRARLALQVRSAGGRRCVFVVSPGPPPSNDRSLGGWLKAARPRRTTLVPLGAWLQWLAAQLDRAPEEVLRSTLPAAPSLSEGLLVDESVGRLWKLEDVLPHLEAAEDKLRLVAEMLRRLERLCMLEDYDPPHLVKGHGCRSELWARLLRQHLRRSLREAMSGPQALYAAVPQGGDGLYDDLDEREARDLVAGEAKLVAVRARFSGCPLCGAARPPGADCSVCRLPPLGGRWHVCSLARRGGAAADPHAHALGAALRLGGSGQLPALLSGKRRREALGGPRRAVGRREPPLALAQTLDGFTSRFEPAPELELWQNHFDHLDVSESRPLGRLFLRSCAAVRQPLPWPALLEAVQHAGGGFEPGAGRVVFGARDCWSFRGGEARAALLALREAVRAAALRARDVELCRATVALHLGGAAPVLELRPMGGDVLLAVQARPLPSEPLTWSQLFFGGYLIYVTESPHFTYLERADFERTFDARDPLTVGLLGEELWRHPRSLQTLRGPGHPVRLAYSKKLGNDAAAQAPLAEGFGPAYPGAGDAPAAPNPRRLPVPTAGGAPLVWNLGLRAERRGQLQEDSLGTNPEAFRGVWRLRWSRPLSVLLDAPPVFVEYLPARVAAAAGRGDGAELSAGLDERGLPRPGRFFALGACLLYAGEKSLWAPFDCWLLSLRAQAWRPRGVRYEVRLLQYVSAGQGDKFGTGMQKMTAARLERPLGAATAPLQACMAAPSIPARNAVLNLRDGCLTRLLLAEGSSALLRGGAASEPQRLLGGELRTLAQLEELQRRAPGCPRLHRDQAVDLRSGRHLGGLLVLPLTLYVAKQTGEEGFKVGASAGPAQLRHKVDPSFFEDLVARGVPPAVAHEGRVCAEHGTLDCRCGAPRRTAALSAETLAADRAARGLGLQLRFELGADAPLEAATTAAAPPPRSPAELLRLRELPSAGALLELRALPDCVVFGRHAAAQIVMDLCCQHWRRAPEPRTALCTSDRTLGHTALVAGGEPVLRGAFGALAEQLARLGQTLQRLRAPLRGYSELAGLRASAERGGALALQLPEAQRHLAVAALRWGAEVLEVRRAVLLAAPELPAGRVWNSGFAAFEGCAERKLFQWLARNLSYPHLAAALEKLPLTEEVGVKREEGEQHRT